MGHQHSSLGRTKETYYQQQSTILNLFYEQRLSSSPPSKVQNRQTDFYISNHKFQLMTKVISIKKKTNLFPQLSFRANDILKDVFAHMRVHSTQRVIQQVDVCIMIHCPSQAYTLLLPSTQVDTLYHNSNRVLEEGLSACCSMPPVCHTIFIIFYQQSLLIYQGIDIKCLGTL